MSFFLLYHGYLFFSLCRKIILLYFPLSPESPASAFRSLQGQRQAAEMYIEGCIYLYLGYLREMKTFFLFDRLLKQHEGTHCEDIFLFCWQSFPIKRKELKPNWKGCEEEKLKWWKDLKVLSILFFFFSRLFLMLYPHLSIESVCHRGE